MISFDHTFAHPQHVEVPVHDPLVREVEPAEVVLGVDVDAGVVKNKVGAEARQDRRKMVLKGKRQKYNRMAKGQSIRYAGATLN